MRLKEFLGLSDPAIQSWVVQPALPKRECHLLNMLKSTSIMIHLWLSLRLRGHTTVWVLVISFLPFQIDPLLPQPSAQHVLDSLDTFHVFLDLSESGIQQMELSSMLAGYLLQKLNRILT